MNATEYSRYKLLAQFDPVLTKAAENVVPVWHVHFALGYVFESPEALKAVKRDLDGNEGRRFPPTTFSTHVVASLESDSKLCLLIVRTAHETLRRDVENRHKGPVRRAMVHLVDGPGNKPVLESIRLE